METRYTISGMTCQHCVNHVTEEVSSLDAVTSVHVSLPGSMTIVSDQEIDFDSIQQAVHEAGDYEVTRI